MNVNIIMCTVREAHHIIDSGEGYATGAPQFLWEGTGPLPNYRGRLGVGSEVFRAVQAG
ncbi:MAG TPA: hypothetical protein H9871_07390 [Candidatus Nesterenkonia stercoripullorum]|uniref:Uncharacterized protein n=1 Tax=Candidatus Nesterenkonia stercoripullorum TaxID=2838701 RepID=A0A9D1UT96_9MICC|nr:hypothetical protein [Candidatus Nesterenkonia stercoripullorum]